ncbi:MAG: large subunit ribosomal protein L9 [Rickettsiales bacterium]|jgi:large subunit ribosomal protein L9
MKIILISRVAKLGNVGDVINVKDGYAKNFLIPQKKAIFYSASNYKVFESKKQQFEDENQKHSSVAEVNKAKLHGKNIFIIENASDDGRLYGSITTAIIATKINEFVGEKIVSRIDILLNKPIKDIGSYDIKIDLFSDVVADIKIVIGRNESEVKDLISKDAAKKDQVSKTPKEKSLEKSDSKDEEENNLEAILS